MGVEIPRGEGAISRAKSGQPRTYPVVDILETTQ